MKNKKKLLKNLGIAAAVVVVLAVAWLIYKPFFWANRGIDPALYEEQGVTGYEWITENMSEHMVYQKELKNEKTGETFVYYECDALREYLPNCRDEEKVSLCHRTNDEYTAWEVGYTYGLNQGTYITYYEGGRERKAISFNGLRIPGISSAPRMQAYIEP